jgi:hypothetical protein
MRLAPKANRGSAAVSGRGVRGARRAVSAVAVAHEAPRG